MRMIENNIDGSEELRTDLARVFGISNDFETELKRLKKEYAMLKDQLWVFAEIVAIVIMDAHANSHIIVPGAAMYLD